MRHFSFYVQHALRDFVRNGRRTAFALFCVAAGVAAIVALRSLSLMIADSLAGNIASVNHGDLKITLAASRNDFSNSNDGREAFSPETVEQIKQWAQENNVQLTEVISNANIQVAPLDNQQNVGRPQFISSYVVDAAVYPFYGPVEAINPAGVPLSSLFTGGNEVVISENLAEANKIKVGDQVRVGRTTELFTVRGIVPSDTEGGIRNPFAAFFGFAYFDKSSLETLNLEPLPDQIYMLAPQGSDIPALEKSLANTVKGMNITTTSDVLEQNRNISDVLNRLILVMGLAALLIGSTGIIHTMLVVVSRRTTEIAVLKTLGLKGRQITLMFLVEAAIMGFIGSLLGLVLGVLFSLAIRSFFQSAWPQSLEWRVYPEAMFSGLLLGVIVTTVFGFMPTLTAAAVRPATVLRPNETLLPVAGCLPSLMAGVLVVLIIGIIAGQILGNVLIGIPVVIIASSALMIVVSLLYALVALIGKLPALGSVDLRLSLRAIGTHRARTASTLLALIVGVFSLSVITLMAESVPRLLNVQFEQAFGGNVMIFGAVPTLQRPFIVAQLKNKPGVRHYNQVGLYTGNLVAVNGNKDWAKNIKVSFPMMNVDEDEDFKDGAFFKTALGTIGTVDVQSPVYKAPAIVEGRALTLDDADRQYVIMNKTDFTEDAGLKVGDELTFEFAKREAIFTVIGIADIAENSQAMSNGGVLSNFGAFTAPVDSFPTGVSPTIEFTLASVDAAHLNQTLVNLSSIPGVFPFDLTFFETLIRRLLAQFTAIPTIVAVLSLLAGAVIIANTVSLTTLERRREVGVMKAVGLSGRRVLMQMVLENGIIGLLGGLLGVGVGVLVTLLMSLGSNIPITQSVSWGIVALLLGLSILISLAATLLSAWTAAREKPLHVLRYE